MPANFKTKESYKYTIKAQQVNLSQVVNISSITQTVNVINTIPIINPITTPTNENKPTITGTGVNGDTNLELSLSVGGLTNINNTLNAVSYTHLRAHETVLGVGWRLLI